MATTAWDQEPPPYSEAVRGEFSTYEAPTSYTIGSKTINRPLVRVGELKAHLSLLKAFKDLRTRVENGQIEEWSDIVRLLDPSQRWTWFIGLAVDRFQRWIDILDGAPLGATLEYELPPLDVLMVWHTYLLNPAWYAEDCLRMAPLNSVRGVRDHLLSALGRINEVSDYDASPKRKELWLQQTGLPYDPIPAATLATNHSVSCPRCLGKVSVPYILPEGTGYLQSKFRATCLACSFNFNRDNLATLKFVRDLVLDPQSEEDKRRYGYSVFLAGSLRTSSLAADEFFAPRLKVKLFVAFPPPDRNDGLVEKDEWIQTTMKRVDYSMENVKKIAAFAFAGMERRCARILTAYINDRPFSVELVGATIRQSSFIDKIHQLGWLESGAFSRREDEFVLQHAIARYHAFLDLTASSPPSLLVPTLDIDLVWHTHMMKGEIYQNDCREYIGYFSDHEDTINENQLATAFDETCRAWEARYHLPYTHCGCPLPSPSGIFSRLGLRRGTVRTGLVPPSSRPDALAATHASEHNAVYVPVRDDAVRRAREEEMLRRRSRDVALMEKGKLDREVVSRAMEHQVAFLGPVDAMAPPAFVDVDVPETSGTGS